MQSGFINIIKPTGMTSSDVVVRTRGILSHHFGEKVKAGHMGTLDPAGAGVLPVAIGRATRLFDYGLNVTKIYRAGFRFGSETDTLDSYGVITKTCDKIPSLQEIIDILPKFIGKIVQVPPNYSSISVAGKRAYDLSRQGKSFELAGREVEVFGITFIEKIGESFVFDIECSSGTYIRSLVRDIAYELGTVGYMSYIIRLKTGFFDIENAVTFSDLEKDPEKYIIPIEDFVSSYKRYDVPSVLSKKVKDGVKIKMKNIPDDVFTVYVDGELLGLGRRENGCLNILTRLL